MTDKPDPFAPMPPTRRCLNCYYVLDHLTTDRCPECGRFFNPDDSRTYTYKAPFVWWTYWLPAMLLAAGLGIITYALLIPRMGFGWTVTLVIPIMIGGVIGYGSRVGAATATIVGCLAVGLCLCWLGGNNFAGVFCIGILASMAIIPLAISVFAGVLLRRCLKKSKWSHRLWLPILPLFLLPLAAGELEQRFAPLMPEVTVTTETRIDAPLDDAWSGVMFYEEVKHRPPWLLRFGLRTPLYTIGSVDHVGARKKCVYSRGHLVKQVTKREPGKSLEFVVVEQQMFEDYSVRLTGGSFEFEAIDASHTRVILKTRYIPLLRPRWAWQPVEEHVVHQLHGHVLEGMAGAARERADSRLALTDAK